MDKEATDAEVARRKKEIKKKTQELQYHSKKRERAEKEKEIMLSQKEEAERYKNWLKEEMKNVLKTVESQKKDSEGDSKLIKDLSAQVKRLMSSLHISQEKNAMQFKLVEVRVEFCVTPARFVRQFLLISRTTKRLRPRLRKTS